jgi:hypothetical protein
MRVSYTAFVHVRPSKSDSGPSGNRPGRFHSLHRHTERSHNRDQEPGVGPFTDLQIKNAESARHCDGTPLQTQRPNGTFNDVSFHDGRGLYLQLSRSPFGQITKYWLYRCSVRGKDRRLGFGPCPTVSLSEARELTKQARRLRKDMTVKEVFRSPKAID